MDIVIYLHSIINLLFQLNCKTNPTLLIIVKIEYLEKMKSFFQQING